MSVIRILPENLRNMIAAGEVVERPASVVKELLENALDAGSTKIEIDIARAGKGLIRVADNGGGMDRDDALLACQRYATSKIGAVEDLFRIRTLGFRGEALSSIASVSRMRLITALPGQTGTLIESDGGETKDLRDHPATGTIVEVRDLFFNTPARRKFLKSDTTENHHIIDSVTRSALSHTGVSFTLRMDGAEALSLPPAASRRERIAQIFGRDFTDALRECSGDQGGIRVALFFGNPLQRSNSRRNQFIFVNERPVRDQLITSAIYRACEDVMPKDSHPVFFAFLDADPAGVDFNVHPAKREVRFADRQVIFSLILAVTRKAISPGDSGSETPFLRDGMPVCPPDARFVSKEFPVPSGGGYPSQGPESQEVMIGDRQDTASYTAGDGGTPFFYVGDTFVAIPGKDGLTLMDYHAAHERVNYEKFLKKTTISAHRLLFPQQVKLTAADYRIIVANIGLLSEFGLDIDDFGHETVVVRSLPDVLRDADAEALLGDLASSLLSREDFADPADPDPGLDPSWSIKRKIAARLACHGSYRGKEDRIRVRIGELLRDLDAAEHPHVCPHGRPTRIFLSLRELKKMFRK